MTKKEIEQTHFTYKGGGLPWPVLLQIIMTAFLTFAWIKGISTGAPILALLILLAISSFIVIMFNFSFPRSFTLDSYGLSVHTTLGQTVRIRWTEIETIRKSGPSFVIKTTSDHWSAKIINKYMAFIPLLEKGEGFCTIVQEHFKS